MGALWDNGGMSATLNEILDDLEDAGQLRDDDALYEAFVSWAEGLVGGGRRGHGRRAGAGAGRAAQGFWLVTAALALAIFLSVGVGAMMPLSV